MDNNKDKPEEKINPVVIMGNMALKLSDILDENNTEAQEKIQAWLDKKEKAFERAEKRKAIRKPYKKRR